MSLAQFQVSVIIPVYNCVDFLNQAVESALALNQVGEVVLVDDGSTDGSFDLCRKWAGSGARVSLVCHDGRRNLGVSASRNLGIRSARFDYIAFLDSDDYYLSNRFIRAREVFESDARVDGVYDAAQYQDDFASSSNNLYSLAEPIEPTELFFQLLKGKKGFFCTNTITIRRELLVKAGSFREDLRMHEDSELWLRFAYYGSLRAGELNTPVAIIRRHELNAIRARGVESFRRFYDILVEYYSARPLRYKEAAQLIRGFWRVHGSKHSSAVRRIHFYFNYAKDYLRIWWLFKIGTH